MTYRSKTTIKSPIETFSNEPLTSYRTPSVPANRQLQKQEYALKTAAEIPRLSEIDSKPHPPYRKGAMGIMEAGVAAESHQRIRLTVR